MKSFAYPAWWDRSIDFAWDHIKVAMKRHWSQLIRPASHTRFDELETVFRFGYGARLEYDTEWNDNLEICLAKEWRTMNPLRQETWEQDRLAILYGWNYEAETAEPEIGPPANWKAQKNPDYFIPRLDQNQPVPA